MEIKNSSMTVDSVTYPYEGDRERYERELAERQRAHLERVSGINNGQWRPCMHDSCPECHGTGIKANGGMCIHNISCPCPKCSPTF
jgi:hypothetical protein